MVDMQMGLVFALSGCRPDHQPKEQCYFSHSRSSYTNKSSDLVCCTFCVDTKPNAFKLSIFFVKYLHHSLLKILFCHLKKEMGAQVQLQILSRNNSAVVFCSLR